MSVCIHCGMPTEPEAVACTDCPDTPATGTSGHAGPALCEQISDFIDGNLPPLERDAFRAHVVACQSCRTNGEDYLALAARAREVLRCAH